MAYISYKNLPIWLGTDADTTTIPNKTDTYKEIFAQSVQLSYSPNLAPVRILGKTPTANNYNLAGPPSATLSFSCYLDPTVSTSTATSFNPRTFTGDVGDNGTTFLIGDDTNGISGSGAFLTSYSFASAPYQPILFQCEFAIYNPLTTTSNGGKIASTDAHTAGFDLNNAAHGAYSYFTSSDFGNLDLFDSFSYQYSCQRLPIYEIGGFYPQSVEFITAEHSFTVESDNIVNLVPLTGLNASVAISVNKPAGGESAINPTVAGRILQENVGIEGGDFGRGSVSITQLLR
jgi:hypothetical protein